MTALNAYPLEQALDNLPAIVVLQLNSGRSLDADYRTERLCALISEFLFRVIGSGYSYGALDVEGDPVYNALDRFPVTRVKYVHRKRD
jgi:hypothetical protein